MIMPSCATGCASCWSSAPIYKSSENVVTARAVELVTEQLPDVALVDLLMPDMDGIAATRKIKRLAPHANYHPHERLCERAESWLASRAGAGLLDRSHSQHAAPRQSSACHSLARSSTPQCGRLLFTLVFALCSGLLLPALQADDLTDEHIATIIEIFLHGLRPDLGWLTTRRCGGKQDPCDACAAAGLRGRMAGEGIEGK
jgi:hypothetical protein